MSKSTEFSSILPFRPWTSSSKPHGSQDPLKSVNVKEVDELEVKGHGKQPLRGFPFDDVVVDSLLHSGSSSNTLLNELPSFQPFNHDGDQVMALLQSKSYTQAIYAPDSHPPTRSATVMAPTAGESNVAPKTVQVRSLLDFLKLNMYTDSVYGRDLQVEIQEIEAVLEDEDSGDHEARLQKALERLKSIYAHLKI